MTVDTHGRRLRAPGLRRPRQRDWLPGSIRFRLTAWYAVLLALILATLGVALLARAEDRLRDDVDTRLKETAAEITAEMERRLRSHPPGEPTSFQGIVPDFSDSASRGLLIQVVDAEDRIVERTAYAPATVPLIPPTSSDRVEPVLGTRRLGETDVRAVRDPLVLVDGDGDRWYIGAVLVGEPLDTLHGTLSSLRQLLLTTSLAGLGLAVAGGWLVAGRALRPVDRVTAAAAAIAAGDGSAASLRPRLPLPTSGDEIARLAATFNAMLDRLEASFLAQQRFVADASHELRTPLTAIRGNVEVLARQVATQAAAGHADADLADALEDMKRESARMGRLLDDLLLLARSDAPDLGTTPAALRTVRVDEVARAAVRSAAALAIGQRLEVSASEAATVRGDADRLHQLLLILLENALRHTPAGERVAVEVAPTAAGSVRLVVRDEGEGISAEHLPFLFDRFYRADGARGRATGGTGLGLAIARAIAHAHGGTISVSSAPGRGSAFTVILPATPSSPAVPSAGERLTAVPVELAD